MTTDENILPDALSPRSLASQEGRPESYWAERNALVDAVKACPLPKDDRCWIASDLRTADEQALWDAYIVALDALKAFDAAHGGSPIL